eukprot:CAMPEP_0197076866 /NCGR_PEP_ID=MMETSP1384-20130603/212333_1 /TAXON_ID=29189 /ORGANISM="Ammonia sp." /LENGTH=596 /DNA_ID=CAMNT_0042515725 /DNA_START=100 /DNA_END=1890 /DNA_ORIENTATION=-
MPSQSSDSLQITTYYDYIVVGSGPGGSVTATRLAAHGYSVLLLEAGNTTQYSLNGTLNVTANTNLTLFDIPLDWDIITINTTYSDQYVLAPDGNGSIIPECGKGIGGSGAINAMIYIRGTTDDFTLSNGWTGDWNNYTNLLKYYKLTENNTNIVDSPYHNNSGIVHISYNWNYATDSLSNAFIAACKNMDFSIVSDFNTPNRKKNICGNYQFLIDNHHDNTNQTIRDSTARAAYRNGVKPKSLTIKPNALAINVIFDPVEKTKAVGVNYVDLSDSNHRTVQTVMAKQEIILSAGTLGTPTILMQSGIGDARILMDKFGFSKNEIILNNTEIGQNYLDGVFTYVQWNVTNELIQNFSLCTPWNSTFGGNNKYYTKQCQLEWKNYTQNEANKTIFDTTGFSVGGFFQSPYSPDPDSNDVQITLQPYDILLRYNKTNIVTAQIANNLPQSVGYIGWSHLNSIHDLNHLVSNASNVVVHGNYLSNEADVNALVYGLNLTRSMFNTPAMRKYIVKELFPGNSVNSIQSLREFVVKYQESADHIVGTCKMGYVVDEELKIMGLKNIRVADASIMPSLPSGNTHATCMMIGEYAAQLLLDSAR